MCIFVGVCMYEVVDVLSCGMVKLLSYICVALWSG